MSSSHHHNFSPSRALSPQIRTSLDTDSQYFAALLVEYQKLGPFRQVLPICSRLLHQEMLRVWGMNPHQVFNDLDVMQHGSPSPGPLLSHERAGGPAGMNVYWLVAPMSPNSHVVKKNLRLEIPIDRYPNFNFVGRLLGPRGNSVKRVEASTGCRIFIRGKGSIKDPEKAEFTANDVDIRLRQAKEIVQELLRPVDEPQDLYKRQQLRELAMFNSGLREESPRPCGSTSPFNSNGMKRAKTDQ